MPAYARRRDGRRLYYVTRGTGSPTVVFESGIAAGLGTWGLIQPSVAEVTRTISYDRAGLGHSDPPSGPRSLSQMAADLHDLLVTAGDPPFILVGHSLGGPIVRSLTYQHPHLVAALLLVDQVAEDCEFYHRRSLTLGVQAGYRLTSALATIGILSTLTGDRPYPQFPPGMRREMRVHGVAPSTMLAGAAEMKCMAPGLRQLKGELPNIPVTLISAGISNPLEKNIRPAVIASHRHQATRLPQGRHLMAHNSGHLIPLDQPEIITTETLRLVHLTQTRR